MAQRDDPNAVTIEPSGFTPLADDSGRPRRRLQPFRVVLLVALVCVAAALVFLFTARSLEVVVEAEGEVDTSISGIALPFGNRYLLRPGEYTLTATAAGYRPVSTGVTVDDSAAQTVELVLQPLPGIIEIGTDPPGATVIIDGDPAGESPLGPVRLAAGAHDLLIRKARYLPHERTLDVTGRNERQEWMVQLAPAWADVAVASEPAGAAILVDGEVVGETPATIEMLRGERQLILQLPAYAAWQKNLQIEAGGKRDLGVIQLQPAAGELVLSSEPSGANVTLDGKFQGRTPVTLALGPGREHRLAVFRPGYRRHTETVSLPAGASDSKTVQLRARLGEVQLHLEPEDALVTIDGRPAGRGSRTLTLPAVQHTLEFSLDGHATERRRITPRPGLPQRLEIALLTKSEARLAGIEPEITTSLGQTLLLFKPHESPLSEFSMGASRREPGRRSNEVLHPVGLRRMFYLQTTEVTNAQFRQFLPEHNSGQVAGTSLNRAHQPAVRVSWQQAASFCNWLSRREGLPPFYRQEQGIVTGFNPDATGYRLPSEAEWAWAARARGDTLLKFPWGDGFPPVDVVENYADKSSAYVTGRVLNSYSDGHVVSAPVASFPPNHRGLYDIGGNVAEWVHDVYTIPSDDGTTQIDPLGKSSGDNYVIRGASWTQARLSDLRLSYRDYGQAGRDDVGFRLARYAE
ncbi:MAG: PEGA domain-containing protein [Halioglobus sp.]|nr:PEGA domain-containing protein [Halioglobus sp.]